MMNSHASAATGSKRVRGSPKAAVGLADGAADGAANGAAGDGAVGLVDGAAGSSGAVDVAACAADVAENDADARGAVRDVMRRRELRRLSMFAGAITSARSAE